MREHWYCINMDNREITRIQPISADNDTAPPILESPTSGRILEKNEEIKQAIVFLDDDDIEEIKVDEGASQVNKQFAQTYKGNFTSIGRLMEQDHEEGPNLEVEEFLNQITPRGEVPENARLLNVPSDPVYPKKQEESTSVSSANLNYLEELYMNYYLTPPPSDKHIDTYRSNTDVYPLRIDLTDKMVLTMKIIRISTFLGCFILVPLILYLTSCFWRTDQNFTFNLTNCKVYFKDDESLSKRRMGFDLEFGFKFGTPFILNENLLSIDAEANEMCIVNIIGSPFIDLPAITMEMSGGMDNILIKDIQGEKAFVTLSNHIINGLKIDLQFGTVALEDIVCKFRNVTLNEGIYSDKLPDKALRVNLTVDQPEGNICIISPFTKQESNGTCDAIDKNYTNNDYQAESNYTCIVKALACAAKRFCDDKNASLTDQWIVISSIWDGQVQVVFDKPAPNNTHKRITKNIENSVNFTLSALSQLNQSVIPFLMEPDISRIQKLQILGINYLETWLYTNKKVYFQAQYWPLVWASASLLSPKVESTKIILIDNTCPTRGVGIYTQSQVSEFLKSIYPKYGQYDVAVTYKQTKFYRIIQNIYGEYQYSKITMSENPLLIIAFFLSALLSMFLTVATVYGLVWKLLPLTLKKYHEYVQKRKNMSVTLGQIKYAHKENKTDEQIAKEHDEISKMYELRGLGTSLLQKDAEEIIRREDLKFRFSLFQIVQFLINYLFRDMVNSLDVFITKIQTDANTFSEKKMNALNANPVSMPLHQFKSLYSRFCNINGFNEVTDLENSQIQDVLDNYGLKIIHLSEIKEPAYISIRLKSLKEQTDTNIDTEQYEKMTPVMKFLHKNCVATQFSSDSISFEEMRQEYEVFCERERIPMSEKGEIIGNPDLIKYGAIADATKALTRIIGVLMKDKTPKLEIHDEFDLLIRVSQNNRKRIFSNLWKEEGAINIVLAIANFVIIALIPLSSPFISFYALCLITTFQADVFKKPITVFDIYYVNRMDPWWDNVPSINIVLYIHIYVLAYLFFAYFEVLCYYLTGWQRKVVTCMFNFYLYVFLVVYLLMAFFSIQWGILGAIFNPTVLLPYSAAIVTFIATVGAKYNFYKSKVQNLEGHLEELIKEKIGYLLIKSLEQIKKNLNSRFKNLMPEITEDSAQKAISDGIQHIMDSDGLDIKKEAAFLTHQVQKQVMNNTEQIAKVLSQSIGKIDPCIVELAIAASLKSDQGIINAISKLGESLYIDSDLIQIFLRFGLNRIKWSGEENGLNYKGNRFEVTSACMQLFRVLFKCQPEIQSIVSDILKVIIDEDPEPVTKMLLGRNIIQQETLTKLDLSNDDVNMILKTLLNILIRNMKSGYETHNNLVLLSDAMKSTLNQGISVHQISINETILLIQKLRKGDVTELLSNESNRSILGYQSLFPVLFEVDCNQDFFSNSNNIIVKAMREIFQSHKILQDVPASSYNSSTQYYTYPELTFIHIAKLIRGSVVDLKSIGRSVNSLGLNLTQPKINPNALQHMSNICGFSKRSLAFIANKLGCPESVPYLYELQCLLNDREIRLVHIAKQSGFTLATGKKLYYLIKTTEAMMHLQILLVKKGNICKKIGKVKSKLSFYLFKLKLDKQLYEDKIETTSTIITQPTLKKEKSADNEAQSSNIDHLTSQSAINICEQSAKLDQSKNTRSFSQDDRKIRDFVDKMTLSTEDIPSKYFQTIIRTIFEQKLRHNSELQSKAEISQFNSEIEALQVLSILSLCFNGKLPIKDNALYYNAASTVKQFAKVSETHQLLLLLDIMKGDPMRIFSVHTKEEDIKYNLSDCAEISAKQIIGYQRAEQLRQIAQGSNELLNHVFARWFHQQQLVKQAAKVKSSLKLSKQYLKMISIARAGEDEYKEGQKEKLQQAAIEQFIQSTLESSGGDFEMTQLLQDVNRFFGKFDISLINFLFKKEAQDMACNQLNLIRIFLLASKEQSLDRFLTLLQLLSLNLYPDIANDNNSEVLKRQEFIGLQIILNIQLLKQCRTNSKLKSAYKQLFGKSFHAYPNQLGRYEEDDELNLIKSLFNNGYLNPAISKLLAPIEKEAVRLQIMGVIIGQLLGDKKLQCSSLIEFMSSTGVIKDLATIEALMKLMTSDYSQINQVNIACEILGLDGNLIESFLKLKDPLNKDIKMTITSLMKSTCSQDATTRVATMLAFVRGDPSQMKPLIESLKIKQPIAQAILSMGNHSICFDEENQKNLYQILGSRCSRIVKSVQELLCLTNFSFIDKCLNLMNGVIREANILDSRFFRSLYLLISYGNLNKRGFYKTEANIALIRSQLLPEIKYFSLKISKLLGGNEQKAKIIQDLILAKWGCIEKNQPLSVQLNGSKIYEQLLDNLRHAFQSGVFHKQGVNTKIPNSTELKELGRSIGLGIFLEDIIFIGNGVLTHGMEDLICKAFNNPTDQSITLNLVSILTSCSNGDYLLFENSLEGLKSHLKSLLPEQIQTLCKLFLLKHPLPLLMIEQQNEMKLKFEENDYTIMLQSWDLGTSFICIAAFHKLSTLSEAELSAIFEYSINSRIEDQLFSPLEKQSLQTLITSTFFKNFNRRDKTIANGMIHAMNGRGMQMWEAFKAFNFTQKIAHRLEAVIENKDPNTYKGSVSRLMHPDLADDFISTIMSNDIDKCFPRLIVALLRQMSPEQAIQKDKIAKIEEYMLTLIGVISQSVESASSKWEQSMKTIHEQFTQQSRAELPQLQHASILLTTALTQNYDQRINTSIQHLLNLDEIQIAKLETSYYSLTQHEVSSPWLSKLFGYLSKSELLQEEQDRCTIVVKALRDNCIASAALVVEQNMADKSPGVMTLIAMLIKCNKEILKDKNVAKALEDEFGRLFEMSVKCQLASDKFTEETKTEIDNVIKLGIPGLFGASMVQNDEAIEWRQQILQKYHAKNWPSMQLLPISSQEERLLQEVLNPANANPPISEILKFLYKERYARPEQMQFEGILKLIACKLANLGIFNKIVDPLLAELPESVSPEGRHEIKRTLKSLEYHTLQVYVLSNESLSTHFTQIYKKLLTELLPTLERYVSRCYVDNHFNLEAFLELVNDFFVGLIDEDADIAHCFQFIRLLVKGEKYNAMDHVEGVARLLMANMQDQQMALQIAKVIALWLQVIMLSISKEELLTATNTKFVDKLTESFAETHNLLPLLGLHEDPKILNLLSRQDVLKAAIVGVIHLAHGNFLGVEELAILLGGAPAREGFHRLKEAVKIVKANKEGLNLQAVGLVASRNVDLAIRAIPVKIPGIEQIEMLIQKGLESPKSLVEPKTFFDIFKNERGVIGLEEFRNIFKQLGIQIPHATALQIFSVADVDKKGELSYQDFTIVLLILQFIFIFVGMSAFSPTTTFSSVVNSLMAAGASIVAMGNPAKKRRQADEVKELDKKSEGL
ncbi:hypothetical protein FGO68_gene5191 [Halteria grandinella]|uniref:EF-hand domain-containing protein n=1 Tax=Halteria grandinella TaxID=5974 RepID=A0A8J8P8W0_HALGN|nr:hypothetical protein FGO68_gene5191 [Halteria grandinella]